jgi:hypothetical protein
VGYITRGFCTIWFTVGQKEKLVAEFPCSSPTECGHSYRKPWRA